MGFFDILRSKKKSIQSVALQNIATPKPRRKRIPKSLAISSQLPLFSGIAEGRKSTDTYSYTQFGTNIFSYVPRQFLEYHRYDLSKLADLSSTDIIRLLVYVEPNVSHAVSNYLRVFDSGYFLTARKPNGSIHSQGQDFLDGLVQRLEHPISDGFLNDTTFSSLYLGLATQLLFDGAISAEEAFTEEYKVQGIYTVDPATIDFKFDQGGVRMYPVQWSGVGEISLDYRNYIYIPVDPIAGDPYGTNQVLSVIQGVMNKFRLLQDFARALHNLGFDRIDASIDQAAIIEACKAQGISEPAKIVEQINSTVASSKTSLQSLEADDNPVHLNFIELKSLEGRNTSRGMDVQAIVNLLLADIASGLKTYATILGKRFGGSSEGYTSVEALLFVKLIEGFQSICKRALDRLFTLALQVEGGISAVADWQWAEPSLRPEYESAQYLAAYSLMLWEEEKMGTISEDERSQRARKMLGFKGAPPPDAVRDPNFNPTGGGSGNQPTPQRDVSQEPGKETKRAQTNRDRKTGGQGGNQ